MCGRASARAGALRAVLLVLGASAVLAVNPTAWPTQFAIKFVSNITFAEGTGMPLEGAMYYDWTRQAQRVEHGAGAVECVHFYNSNLPCTIFFTPTGLYRVLQKLTPARRTRVLPGHALDQGVATRLGRPIKRDVQRDDYRGIFKIAREGIQLPETSRPKREPHIRRD